MASCSSSEKGVTLQERKIQYKILRAALTARALPPALFLHGLSSSGKSFVIEKVLEECKTATKARISAAEAMCGKRAFFETILRQLGVSGDLEGEEGSRKSKIRCENAQMFLRVLAQTFEGKHKPVIVIVENFELMKSESNKEILTALLLAHDICGVNICFVLSSTLPFSSFSAAKAGIVKSVPSIYFPQYSKEEIFSIITREPPKGAELSAYRFYVKALIDVFYRSCRELRKLKRLALINYASFANSIPESNIENENTSASGIAATPKSSRSKEQQLHKLWRNIEPKLKSDFVTLNSQFMPISSETRSNLQRKTQIQSTPQPSSSSSSTVGAGTSSNSKLVYELPEYSKYILISAFIASNNPPTSDKRFFVKAKMKNTTVGAAKKRFLQDPSSSTKNKQSAAKVFPYNRLQAIFSSICSTSFMVQGRKRPFTNLSMDTAHMSQIMTLCDARLISVSGGDDSLENRKFKCLADFDLVNAISSSVDFELSKYLYDFL